MNYIVLNIAFIIFIIAVELNALPHNKGDISFPKKLTLKRTLRDLSSYNSVDIGNYVTEAGNRMIDNFCKITNKKIEEELREKITSIKKYVEVESVNFQSEMQKSMSILQDKMKLAFKLICEKLPPLEEKVLELSEPFKKCDPDEKNDMDLFFKLLKNVMHYICEENGKRMYDYVVDPSAMTCIIMNNIKDNNTLSTSIEKCMNVQVDIYKDNIKMTKDQFCSFLKESEKCYVDNLKPHKCDNAEKFTKGLIDNMSQSLLCKNIKVT